MKGEEYERAGSNQNILFSMRAKSGKKIKGW